MGTVLGILLAMAGGVMVGNCMVPLKYLRRWRWENAWVVFSLVALVLIPWSLAFLRVPHLLAVYSSVNRSNFLMPFLYGAGWGIAQVLFGLAVVRVGMALAFAVTIGLSAALGTLVPIMSRSSQILVTERGHVLLLGLLLMMAGVLCCSWAGRRREKEQRNGSSQSAQGSYIAGILMAVAAGLLAPMLNYALAFGDVFILEAIKHHAAPPDAPYAVWPIALAGGAIPNIAYAVFLAKLNKSWGYFSPVWPDMIFATIMGVLWMGSVAIYGTATTFLGVLGASEGWSIFQICIIFTANISGWLSGEWNGVSRQSRIALWVGLLLLGLATLSISYGSH
jgi:L-rhamnose-H+ transport protein